LEARPDRNAEVIWFLTDVRGLKDDEIEDNPNVCLTFVYPKERVYLSITGKAFVSRDPECAKALWNGQQLRLGQLIKLPKDFRLIIIAQHVACLSRH
jgi:general stress protein 26